MPRRSRRRQSGQRLRRCPGGGAGGGGGLGVAALEFAAAEAFALAHHDATVGVVAFKLPDPPGAPAPAAKTVLDHFQNPARPGA